MGLTRIRALWWVVALAVVAPAATASRHQTPQGSAAATYTNPVYGRDFPDPFILRANGRFYVYATHGSGYGFQVMESPDMVHWTHRGTAFTPPWSSDHLWAPEVVRYRGRYYMTYSALNPTTHKHDIGIATCDSPLGPFHDRGVIVHGDANGVGVIDATLFFGRGGAAYIIYSEEEPRRIVMRSMSADLLKATSDPIDLVRPDRPWERGVTEAPTLVLRDGVYHLFFSVGWFQSNKQDACYAVCHAKAHAVTGPYVKDPEPILKTIPGHVYGPGHQCVLELPDGEWWMGYHAWDDQNEPRYGSNPVGRTLRVDRIRWIGDTPIVDGPTTSPQALPGHQVVHSVR